MNTAQDKRERRTPAALKCALSITGIIASTALILIPLSELSGDSPSPVVEQPVIQVDELPDADAGNSPEYTSELASSSSKDSGQIVHVQVPVTDVAMP